jgi:hypothetical protein
MAKRRIARAVAGTLALAALLPPASAAGPAARPIAIPNAGFEEGAPGGPPAAWAGTVRGTGDVAGKDGYAATLDAVDPAQGRFSVRLEQVGPGSERAFGVVASALDARPYRRMRIRLTGAVRTAIPEGSMVGLWLRVDRSERRMGFFDNMGDRPIRGRTWADYVIEADVASDAEGIAFGLLLAGGGKAWLDNVRLDVLGPSPPPVMPAPAYLEQAIALLRAHHINSAKADWARIAADARAAIRTAAAPADTYDAIRGMLKALGEPHSFLMPPRRLRPAAGRGAGVAAPAPAMPTYSLVDGRFGLVRLPGFVGSPQEVARYSGTLRQGLTMLDRQGVCGWIVDLRGDTGGNMWPMLNGLDPLLGKGPFGSFRDPAGHLSHWVRAGGTIRPDADRRDAPPAFTLRAAARPVAVLLDGRTMSSGEITATALAGRQNVRSFGAPTGGFTTANGTYPLADGAQLVITTAYIRDRTGREYKGPIQPDAPVDPEAAPAAARRWLAAQPCR